ncbi:DUF1097 domain-containing protein [Stutzerimonas urumqiensis]|uniref:DUF1097 domain-containing protein n=1 Tax=Stutzerimonas urumqiensis TaxID=638269 RepID=UPI003BA9A880
MNKTVSTRLKAVTIESVIASTAATLCVVVFEVPVWAMFVGWISYFTRGLNLKQGAVNLVCVLIGLVLGISAAYCMAMLTPLLGDYAISAVVFAITVITLSMGKVRVFNNLLGFFLGLVTYFASHQPPSLEAFGMLALAATMGAVAALGAHTAQKRIQASPRPEASV